MNAAEQDSNAVAPRTHGPAASLAGLAARMVQADFSALDLGSLRHRGLMGEQGEEHWADIMRAWLPPAYEVVTRACLAAPNGQTSPEWDLLILSPAYPPALRHKKILMLEGVVAAFECKVSLRPSDIDSIVRRSVELRQWSPPRLGSPYEELNQLPIAGLLAHHSRYSSPVEGLTRISDRLDKQTRERCCHPRALLDVLCVGNLACWAASKSWVLVRDEDGRIQDATTGLGFSHLRHAPPTMLPRDASGHLPPGQVAHAFEFSPVGKLIVYLLERLAWEDPMLRPIASHFRRSLVGGRGGEGSAYAFRLEDVYSARVLKRLEPDGWDSHADDTRHWNMWDGEVW